MHNHVCVTAPAKINWHLDILDKREDGFHRLLSIFQLISLWDTICIRALKDNTGIILKGDFNFPDEENIIVKAAKIFLQQAGLGGGLEIDVQKEIPMGAGLGGGSSDGAATLNALNVLFGNPIPVNKLLEMGALLGSDVPFFINSTAAVVGGRGEEIRNIIPRKDFYLLLLYPDFKVNTGWAYRRLDESRDDPVHVKEKMPEEEMEALYRGSIRTWRKFGNSFAGILAEEYPVYNNIIQRLSDSGAWYCNISGSGSAVFGVFDEHMKAEHAQKLFSGEYTFCKVLKPLDKRPMCILD